MEAGYSTRMGAAMRHAGYYLGKRQAEKKLLLILTDGEPPISTFRMNGC